MTRATCWVLGLQLWFATGAWALEGRPLRLHNAEGQSVLNGVLSDSGFWAGAWQKTYTEKPFDEIRLKRTASGYVPMITGEGTDDYDPDVVGDVVYRLNVNLPKYMSGAKTVSLLGSGYDSVIGSPYRDYFYIIDLSLFHAYFAQRMYRRDQEGQVVVWFEKLDKTFVDGATWLRYETKMQQDIDALDRGFIFGRGMEPVGELYGMFVVEPGSVRQSRVRFVSKLAFSDDAGWIARAGSKMGTVIRAGLRSGFEASVLMANAEQGRRDRAAERALAKQREAERLEAELLEAERLEAERLAKEAEAEPEQAAELAIDSVSQEQEPANASD